MIYKALFSLRLANRTDYHVEEFLSFIGFTKRSALLSLLDEVRIRGGAVYDQRWRVLNFIHLGKQRIPCVLVICTGEIGDHKLKLLFMKQRHCFSSTSGQLKPYPELSKETSFVRIVVRIIVNPQHVRTLQRARNTQFANVTHLWIHRRLKAGKQLRRLVLFKSQPN